MQTGCWLISNSPKGFRRPAADAEHPWWRVMCLTGVDYFSTLGYQSGIAFLAAGILSPIATLVLVLVTLFAALPVYNRVAAASPNGQGSIAMLERLFPGWAGKVFALVLLGFASTDFVITMTLSAADAAAHFVTIPTFRSPSRTRLPSLSSCLPSSALSSSRGFKEAVNVAVILVGCLPHSQRRSRHRGYPHMFLSTPTPACLKNALFAQHSSILSIVGLSLLLFPRLALGLSGFETGVVVMPLIRSKDIDERIRNTKRLLATAAIVMSIFLMATSIITTLLIPAAEFKSGGAANGRAMAYLAHQYLGLAFGSVYDVSTILILAFAGASAMAGLLNLIPRYLPGFGMAPEWARASRPLVLVFLVVAFSVTLLFHANVDAQGGAYATGVLVLITSGSCAVTLAARNLFPRIALGFVSLIFIYTTLTNIYERPEGLKISCIFIVTMGFMSLVSRAVRSTELRITGVDLDDQAQALLADHSNQTIRLIAWNPRTSFSKNRDQVNLQLRLLHGLSANESIYFIEVERGDTSDFTERLLVEGRREGSNRIFHARSAVVANSIAALLIYLEHTTGMFLTFTSTGPISALSPT